MPGFGKDGKGQILNEFDTITLGTLAAQSAIGAGNNYPIGDEFRLISTKFFAVMNGHTPGEGPILLGIADNELSDAEIGFALSLEPTDKNDNAALESTHRPVFILGAFNGGGTTGFIGGAGDGQMGKETVRWTFSNPEGWTWFAFNSDPAALTTGTVVTFYARHYGVWVR